VFCTVKGAWPATIVPPVILSGRKFGNSAAEAGFRSLLSLPFVNDWDGMSGGTSSPGLNRRLGSSPMPSSFSWHAHYVRLWKRSFRATRYNLSKKRGRG
jgi:hypothetical protein